MKESSYKFINDNIDKIRQIDINKSYGQVDLAFKTELERIGNEECWSYCRGCNSGFIRLIHLCLENYKLYEQERQITEDGTKKRKRKPKDSISN